MSNYKQVIGFAQVCIQLLEMGPLNNAIHKKIK